MMRHYSIYKDLFDNFRNIYGVHTVLLFQVGCKYEIYGSQKEYIKSISKVSGLVWMKKVVNDIEQMEYYFTSICIEDLERYIEILLKECFTIIVYKEETHNNDKILKTRYISDIVFPYKENDYVFIPKTEESYVIV